MKELLIAGVLAFAALPALAQPIHDDGMTGEEFATWLRGQGYQAELTKDGTGDPMVKSSTGGVNFTVFFYDCVLPRCKAVQFSTSFDVDTPMTAEKINGWNKTKRYLKAYVDDEGDPYVQYDVNLNDGRSISGLNDDFGVWTSILDDFVEFIGW